MAALIALARHYSTNQPQHDIYFILSPGHHSPTGGNAYVLKIHPDLGARALLSVNLEHVGQRGTYVSYFGEGGLGRATDKYGIHQATYVGTTGDSQGRELTGQPLTPTMRRIIREAAVDSDFLVTVPMTVFSDPEQRALINAGSPTIQNVETSIWYHTSGDTVETLSSETLQRSLLFYKGIVDRADKMSRAELKAN